MINIEFLFISLSNVFSICLTKRTCMNIFPIVLIYMMTYLMHVWHHCKCIMVLGIKKFLKVKYYIHKFTTLIFTWQLHFWNESMYFKFSVFNCSKILHNVKYHTVLLFSYRPELSIILYCYFQFRRYNRSGFDPWGERIPWRKRWQSTPVFWPGKPMDRGAWQATQFMELQRVRYDLATKQQAIV